MPDLLLELYSEEIPARMQARAATDLKKMVTDLLVDNGLVYEGAKEFSTPQRLVLCVAGIPVNSPTKVEERKGPRVDAPEQAIAGFLGAAGLNSIEDAQIKSDPKKGDYYVAVIEKSGQEAGKIISEIVPQVIRKFPWPKSMKWGSGNLRWIRPLHSVLCTFGPETEETQIIKFDLDGIPVGNVTFGHRFLNNGKIKVRRFSDYEEKLKKAFVILDPVQREDIILNDARELAFAQGLELVEDEELLHEVAGLVEYPIVLRGQFDESYLELPDEVIKTTIRKNQKCFVLRKVGSDKLANQFIMVSNLDAIDTGKAIVAGNERVISARLSDAQFFWNLDKSVRLADRSVELKKIVFHQQLGSVADRVKRITLLSRRLSLFTKSDVKKVERATNLVKNDLVTEMVKEFPELQGIMGSYYADVQGESAEVCNAIVDHYKPFGPNDKIPTEPVSVTVALADKLDILTGFWAIGEKPTSSKDPFALRRAALGIVSIILEKDWRVPLRKALGFSLDLHQLIADKAQSSKKDSSLRQNLTNGHDIKKESVSVNDKEEIVEDLLLFFAERLKVQLRERGGRYDYIDAVFTLAGQDDLVGIVKRIKALEQFLTTDDGTKLLAGYKRAVNIVNVEEKKDGIRIEDKPNRKLYCEVDEENLFKALSSIQPELNRTVESENYVQTMMTLGSLREPIDNFFENVMVNDDNPEIRLNRLKLLNQVREVMLEVADFSKISGETRE